LDEYNESKKLGINTKPVILGPVSYLLFGKEKESGFERIDLIKNLLPMYMEILQKLEDQHVDWVKLDDPFLYLDFTAKDRAAFKYVYSEIRKRFPRLQILLATYFEIIGYNTD
jgi:5-methyltetrahydropteroyltriglutamate--homocysteine methyltransferase